MTYAGKETREEIGMQPLAVKRLLGQDQLHAVPLFQRPYVLTRKRRWEPLREDVSGVVDSILARRAKAHFLGAVTGGIAAPACLRYLRRRYSRDT
jgi:hypothetical protein